MSITHIVNSKGAAAVAAAEDAAQFALEQGMTQTEALAAIQSGVCVLNGRFEEAFKTGTNDEDFQNGND